MSRRGAQRDSEDVVESWNDFLKHGNVARGQMPQSSVLFRGQADAELPLRPSLLRAVAQALDGPPRRKQVLAYEEACCEEFMTQAHLHLGAALLTGMPTVVHWWMHMQHFGAPTRLLDWTRSPFVAAYFACESQPDRDGAVWCLDVSGSDFSMPRCFSDAPSKRDRQQLENIFLTPRARPRIHLLNMGLRNERMVAQQGVFMLSTDPGVSHDEVLGAMGGSGDRTAVLRKIRIPKRRKRPFYSVLLAMNLTARSLFPGIDGLGRSISELARFGALPDLDLT